MKRKRPRSQDQILSLIEDGDRELSAKEIFVALREAGQALGLATIYRALDALKLEGRLHVRNPSGGEARYRSVNQADRHHMTCLQCGCSIELDCCPVSELDRQLQKTHQFQIYYHTLEFFGRCAACSSDDPQDDRSAQTTTPEDC